MKAVAIEGLRHFLLGLLGSGCRYTAEAEVVDDVYATLSVLLQ